MNRDNAETFIKAALSQMGQRLDQASAITKAAQVCSDSGNIGKAVEIALEIEQLAYEASRLLDAVSLVQRLHLEAGTSCTD